MEGTQTPTFRPTVEVWPARPPDLPRVRPVLAELAADGHHYTVPAWGSALHPPGPLPEPVDVPEDFCFRECIDPDPGDPLAVLAFIRSWGTLSPTSSPFRDPLDSLPTRGIFTESLIADPVLRDQLIEATAWTDDAQDPRRLNLVVESHYLRVLRALVGHYRRHALLTADCRTAWQAEGFRCADEREAWNCFGWIVNAAARPFSLHIRIDGDPMTRGLFDPVPSTYEVAVLQLARVVAEERDVLLCANVRCGRPFTRQRGRAKYPGAEHATGVRYCSRECARAQAERDRRARRAADKAAAAKGVGR